MLGRVESENDLFGMMFNYLIIYMFMFVNGADLIY